MTWLQLIDRHADGVGVVIVMVTVIGLFGLIAVLESRK